MVEKSEIPALDGSADTWWYSSSTVSPMAMSWALMTASRPGSCARRLAIRSSRPRDFLQQVGLTRNEGCQEGVDAALPLYRMRIGHLLQQQHARPLAAVLSACHLNADG
jgi:hypothetical protein